MSASPRVRTSSAASDRPCSRSPWVLVLAAALVLSGDWAVGAAHESNHTDTSTTTAAVDGDAAAAEEHLLALMNADRVAHGIAPLVGGAVDLTVVARRWSASMAERNHLAHNASLAAEVCCWQRLAENVGVTRPPDALAIERLHRRFMDSADHRRNNLDERMHEAAVGVVRTADALWVTVLFRAGERSPITLQSPTIVRAGGSDRAMTAAAISRQIFDSSEVVLLASASSYPDALAGAALSAALDAPILLAGSHLLPAVTAEEIRRLGAEHVMLLGGSSAMGWGVVHGLRLAGVRQVDRIAGPDRFETAAAIARAVGGQHVYLVEGAHSDMARGWPDALSVASLAAHTRRPVLLVTRDGVPDATVRALRDLGATRATVVGGGGAVSATVVDQLRLLGLQVDRLSGATRYATSAAVADMAIAEGMSSTNVWLATGRDWPDALTAGPAAARRGSVLMLIDGLDPRGGPSTHRWLSAHREQVRGAWLVGGGNAITDEVAATVLHSIDLR
jgi:putative cell wall-binding protein